MENNNKEYCILRLSYVGYNYIPSNILTYIKLNILSSRLNKISLKSEFNQTSAYMLYWSVRLDLIDNANNYKTLEAIYDILVKEGLKNNYSPNIYIDFEDYSLDLKDISKEDYAKESTKKMFLCKLNNLSENLKMQN